MKRKKGAMGAIMGTVTALMFIGLFLAVLAQFGGDLGALFQWILNAAFNFIISVRDSIAGWDTFQRLF